MSNIDLNKLFEFSKNYLRKMKPNELSEGEFKEYFAQRKSINNKQEIMVHLLEALQTPHAMPNIIGFEKRKEEFRKILFDFNPQKIVEQYKNDEQLFQEFSKHFEIGNADSKGNTWRKYSKSILSSANFINSFKSAEDFDRFVELLSYNEHTRLALPLLLSEEIYGLGFALSCEFLKEMGYLDYPKPDVHLINIFSELGISSKNEVEVYKAIINMAMVLKKTPYEIDKVFWLIGSGNFYKHGIRVPGKRKEFVEAAKEFFSL